MLPRDALHPLSALLRKGQKLSINGQPGLLEESPDLGHGTIVCGEQEEEVKEWLKALEEK